MALNMNKNHQLLLCFLGGLLLIIIMGYLLLSPNQSAVKFGFVLICCAVFFGVLKKISSIKNDKD